jgi:cell wall-associated NlpC family hydrolase
MKYLASLFYCCLVLALAACSTTPPAPAAPDRVSDRYVRLPDTRGSEAVVFAMGLLDTGYRFGGSNPEAGLDCSGMIGYVFEQVAQLKLPHNAAQIAGMTRPVPPDAMQPGDLVFFNTLNRPYSHVGLYIGDGRFIHAPSSRGKVRIERLDSSYFAKRFEGARTLLVGGGN